ncbi:MAG: hypothetical protein GY804_01695 [Alphaproteobacteria bacterium]|nr:hypothetical protein [Alphaproteobacteria bacterium]
MTHNEQKSEMITFKELLFIALQYKNLIGKFTASALLIAILYLNFATKKYEAQIVFSSIDNLGSTSLNKKISPFMSSSMSDDPTLLHFSHLLNSGAMAHQLVNDDKVMQTVFATEYDKEDKKWRAPFGLKPFIKRVVLFICGFPTYTPPDANRLTLYLNEEINVSEIEKSGLFEVSYKHTNPEFAQYLLNKTYALAEDRMRQEELRKSIEISDYISNKIDETKNITTANTLTSLLLKEERKKILLNNNQPIAARRINTVPISKMPASPKPKMVLILALAFGLISGFITAIIKAKHLR